MKYYSAMKKKAVMPFLSAWMNLEDTMLNKINQTEEEKYCYYLPDTWHLNKSNSQVKTEWKGGRQGLKLQRMRSRLSKGTNFQRDE